MAYGMEERCTTYSEHATLQPPQSQFSQTVNITVKYVIAASINMRVNVFFGTTYIFVAVGVEICIEQYVDCVCKAYHF